jgi:hypothetical protein
MNSSAMDFGRPRMRAAVSWISRKRSLAAAIDARTRPDSWRACRGAGRSKSVDSRGSGSRKRRHAGTDFPNRRNSLEPSRSSSVSKTSRLSRPGVPSAFCRQAVVERSKTSLPKRRLRKSACRSLVGSAPPRWRRSGSGSARATGSVGDGRSHGALLLDRRTPGSKPRRAANGRRPAAFRPRVRHSARPSKQEIG